MAFDYSVILDDLLELDLSNLRITEDDKKKEDWHALMKMLETNKTIQNLSVPPIPEGPEYVSFLTMLKTNTTLVSITLQKFQFTEYTRGDLESYLEVLLENYKMVRDPTVHPAIRCTLIKRIEHFAKCYLWDESGNIACKMTFLLRTGQYKFSTPCYPLPLVLLINLIKSDYFQHTCDEADRLLNSGTTHLLTQFQKNRSFTIGYDHHLSLEMNELLDERSRFSVLAESLPSPHSLAQQPSEIVDNALIDEEKIDSSLRL